MHGQIYAAFKEGVFQLFNEDPLRSDLARALLLEFVAGSLDDHEFRFNAGDTPKGFANAPGLPESQSAASGPDSRRLQGFSRSR